MLKIIVLLSLTVCIPVWASFENAHQAYQEGNDVLAKRLFERHSNSAMAKVYLSRLSRSTDLDEAEKWIEMAVKQNDSLAEVHFERGIVMGQQASQAFFSALSYANKSADGFRRAVELAPHNLDYQIGLIRFLLSAPGIAGGDAEEAERIVASLTQADPLKGAIAQTAYWQEMDNPEQLLNHLEQARALHPKYAGFYYQAGLIYQQQGRFDKAMKRFRQATAVATSTRNNEILRLQALYQIGRTAVLAYAYIEEGLQAYEQFLSDTFTHRDIPSKGWARYRQANLLELQQRRNEARTAYLQLSHHTDQELANHATQKLANMD